MKVLLGHHDVASAYVSPRARHWIETRPNFGQRACLRWLGHYAIERCTYDAAIVYYLDDVEGFSVDHLYKGAALSEIDAFVQTYAEAMKDEAFRHAIAWARASAFRRKAIRPAPPLRRTS